MTRPPDRAYRSGPALALALHLVAIGVAMAFTDSALLWARALAVLGAVVFVGAGLHHVGGELAKPCRPVWTTTVAKSSDVTVLRPDTSRMKAPPAPPPRVRGRQPISETFPSVTAPDLPREAMPPIPPALLARPKTRKETP